MDAKCNVTNNLKCGCEGNLRKDFKTYDVMQAGKYNIAVGKVIAPVQVFIDEFGLPKIFEEHKSLMKERNAPLIFMIHSFKKALTEGAEPTLVKYLSLFSDKTVMAS